MQSSPQTLEVKSASNEPFSAVSAHSTTAIRNVTVSLSPTHNPAHSSAIIAPLTVSLSLSTLKPADAPKSPNDIDSHLPLLADSLRDGSNRGQGSRDKSVVAGDVVASMSDIGDIVSAMPPTSDPPQHPSVSAPPLVAMPHVMMSPSSPSTSSSAVSHLVDAAMLNIRRLEDASFVKRTCLPVDGGSAITSPAGTVSHNVPTHSAYSSETFSSTSPQRTPYVGSTASTSKVLPVLATSSLGSGAVQRDDHHDLGVSLLPQEIYASAALIHSKGNLGHGGASASSAVSVPRGVWPSLGGVGTLSDELNALQTALELEQQREEALLTALRVDVSEPR